MDKDSGFNYLFNPNGYALFINIDYFNTSGADYFGVLEGFSSYFGARALVVMSPGGSLRGYIYDERKNLVSGVEIKLDCLRVSNNEYHVYSDRYGSFFIEGVPAKDCRVWARKGNSAGFIDVRLTGGGLKQVNIVLDKELRGEVGFGQAAGVVVLFLIFFGAVWFFVIGKKDIRKGLRKVEKELEGRALDLGREVKFGRRALDVLKTLSYREADVVEFIVKHKSF